jgi:predicted permease
MRLSLRVLLKRPWFAVTAVVTIAFGIGASTAIFSVANAVILRPLPYPDADRLILAFWENPAVNAQSFMYSNADFSDLRAGTSDIFEDMGGITSFRAFVSGEDGSTEQLSKALVTVNFLGLMGARIALGRDFTSADAVPQPGSPDVLIPPGSATILSYEYWQRHYGGRGDAIGQTIAGGPVIVGVLAPGFKLFFPPPARIDAFPDFYVANNLGYDAAHRNLMTVSAIGKLRRGVTLARAQQRLDALRAAIRRNSFDPDAALRLEPMGRYLVDEIRPAILALFGAVLFLLLIACTNAANLMLVRVSARERELAVRAALGGSRWRLTKELLAEAGWIAGAGTAAGVALAWWGVRGLVSIAPAGLPRIDSAGVDWRVLAFAALAGVCSVGVFGWIPAIRASAPDVNRIIRGADGASEFGLLRKAVMIMEVALSFVLLVGSGLMARSFLDLRRVDPGYDPRGVLTFFVTRDWPLEKQEGRIELLREIQSRLSAVPGVESATAALVLPLGGGARPKGSGGFPAAGAAGWQGVEYQQVMADYFETLRTRLIAGRTFTDHDNSSGHPVAVIDELLAEHAFPNGAAVGQRILLAGPGNPAAEVVGVVAHQRLFSLADSTGDILFLADGGGSWGIGVSRYWMVRTHGDPSRLAPAIRAEIAKIDRQLVVSKVQTLDALVERDQSGTRFELLLIGVFASVATLLAGVGLYTVLATIVRRRTAEIGVRMALGAAPSSIFRMVVGQGLKLSALGVAIGWAAAAWLTRIMNALLVGITATDPSTFAGMAAVFLAIAAAASWIPAARAARVDPMTALRSE